MFSVIQTELQHGLMHFCGKKRDKLNLEASEQGFMRKIRPRGILLGP